MRIDFKFSTKEKVIIDGDSSIKAVITAARVSASGAHFYEVEWMDGHMRTATVEDWRLDYAN